MGWTVDTTGVDDFEGLDEGGSKCDPGIHLAELIDTYQDDEKGDQVFKFNVLSPPSRGSKLQYRLYDPEMGATPEKAATRRKQCLTIMKRLGVLTEKDLNNPGFEPNWLSAIGKKFVIDVIHEDWTNDKGTKVTTAKITMYGIMDLQSAHVKAIDRRRLGLPVLPEQLEAEKAAADATAHSGGPKPRKTGGGRAGSTANSKHAVGASAGVGAVVDTSDL